MRVFLLVFLVLGNFTWCKAQPSTSAIFEKTIAKVKTLKSVSYSVNSTTGNIFSKDDITKSKARVSVVFNNGAIDYKLREVFDDNNNRTYSEVYRDGKSYTFDIIDGQYSLNDTKEIGYDLADFAKVLSESLEKNPEKIIRKADTIYQNIDCYSFFIKKNDTVLNGQHDFTHKYLLIDKKNFLPVSLIEKGEGTASKGGYTIGRVVVNNQETYADIKVNPKIATNPIFFEGFYLKNSKMLAIGDTSPQLQVKTLSGAVVDDSTFKNKNLLVVFGSIACAANPLANPVLNRLHEKYKNSNLAILAIFTSETGEQVKKYVVANKLNFPTYLATRKQHSDFKIISTPNFYIIGTDGKIKVAMEGYSDKLENQLTKTIDELVTSR